MCEEVLCVGGKLLDSGTGAVLSAPEVRSKPKRKPDPTPNDSWKEVLQLIEPYLDVEGMLCLRSCATLFYRHKYKPYNNVLQFGGLRGYDPNTVVEKILPVACRAVSISTRENLRLDFGGNTLFKDVSVARLMDAVHGDKHNNLILGNLRELNFSFCYSITDKGLAALLTTNLPFLEKLSLRCARSKHLTGGPFTTDLVKERWPRFIELDCSFTNTWLEPCEIVSKFITQNAAANGTSPKIHISGSWASRCFFEKVSKASIWNAFCEAVKLAKEPDVNKLTKLMHLQLAECELEGSALLELVREEGSVLLVNAPICCSSSSEGELDLWTLPIIIALQKCDESLFSTLLRRGAYVDVWDYLGKSLACHACELERSDFLETLLERGASPLPYDLGGPSALGVAIRRKNVCLIETLLRHGTVLNYKCPGLKQFKSPLYVACELCAVDKVAGGEIVQLLLSSGADPNWRSHNKFTPTMLAYQLNSAWLPLFINAGAGSPKNYRWVLTEVLGCAVMKNDLSSVQLLCSTYPDLLERSHLMWNKPHVQAAKLGKVEILSYLLSIGADTHALGDHAQTALHHATEEGYVECVKLLLLRNADVNAIDEDGHTPLHIACLENRYDVADMLLKLGECKISVCDELFGETPLMICIRTRNSPMSQLVVKYAKTQDCDVTDKQGRTALTYALFFGQYSVADCLMECGADVRQTNESGNSCYTIVCERLLTQGCDRRVLKKYLRLYKARGQPRRRSPLKNLTDSSKHPEAVVSDEEEQTKIERESNNVCSKMTDNCCFNETTTGPNVDKIIEKNIPPRKENAAIITHFNSASPNLLPNIHTFYNVSENHTPPLHSLSPPPNNGVGGEKKTDKKKEAKKEPKKDTKKTRLPSPPAVPSIASKISRLHIGVSKTPSKQESRGRSLHKGNKDDSSNHSSSSDQIAHKNEPKKPKNEHRAILNVAKLPMALFRAAAKAK